MLPCIDLLIDSVIFLLQFTLFRFAVTLCTLFIYFYVDNHAGRGNKNSYKLNKDTVNAGRALKKHTQKHTEINKSLSIRNDLQARQTKDSIRWLEKIYLQEEFGRAFFDMLIVYLPQ